MNTKRLRNIFLVLFVASTVFVFVLSSTSTFNSPPNVEGTESPGIITTAEPGDSSDDPSTIPPSNNDSGALLGSIITSVTSLIGFATTTLITWRKEKRDTSLADVERRKLEIELEKNRLELEELRKGIKKKVVKRKSKK